MFPLLVVNLILHSPMFSLLFIPNCIYSIGIALLLVNFFMKEDPNFTKYVFVAYARTLINYYMFLINLFTIILDSFYDDYNFSTILVICILIMLFEIFINLHWSNELKNAIERFADELYLLDSQIEERTKVNRLIN